MQTTETRGMPTEIAIEDRDQDGAMRTYVEVGVDEGDDVADLYAEDAEGDSVRLRLAVSEIDALIASLQRAKAVALANH